MIPPEAQAHLLAAQRELLLAVTIVAEHHLRRRGGDERPRARPTKIELE